MTNERTPPRKLVLDPAQIEKLKAFGLRDCDIEELVLVKAINSAIEEQLATPNGDGTYVCIIDGIKTVDALIKAIAHYLGMARSLDNPEHLLETIMGLTEKLFQETMCARMAFKAASPAGNVHVIDEDEPSVSRTVN